jgi:GGDEF domain-containing protein
MALASILSHNDAYGEAAIATSFAKASCRKIAAGVREVGKAALNALGRARQPVSIAVFDQSDLPELQRTFGSHAAREVVGRIMKKLRSISPATGLLFRPSPTVFVVLLPGYGGARALAAVRRALGQAVFIESDWDGEEIVLVPDFLVRTLSDKESMREVYEQMLADIKAAQQYAHARHVYLQLERESHLPKRQRSTTTDGSNRRHLEIPWLALPAT